jgi:hypothetical protein
MHYKNYYYCLIKLLLEGKDVKTALANPEIKLAIEKDEAEKAQFVKQAQLILTAQQRISLEGDSVSVILKKIQHNQKLVRKLFTIEYRKLAAFDTSLQKTYLNAMKSLDTMQTDFLKIVYPRSGESITNLKELNKEFYAAVHAGVLTEWTTMGVDEASTDEIAGWLIWSYLFLPELPMTFIGLLHDMKANNKKETDEFYFDLKKSIAKINTLFFDSNVITIGQYDTVLKMVKD